MGQWLPIGDWIEVADGRIGEIRGGFRVDGIGRRDFNFFCLVRMAGFWDLGFVVCGLGRDFICCGGF